jgi:hypothetical protein
VTPRARGPFLAGTTAVVVALATACSTTYDTSATTVPATTSTVYVASGSTAELLAALSAEVGALSERLVDNDGQRDALTRIEAQWALARPGVEQQHPELLPSFDAAIAHVRRSVERRRPADADKAAKNLDTLIAAYHDSD